MLSLPVLAGLEQRMDLLAGARCPDGAEHQRIPRRRQIRLAADRRPARDPLARTDVEERARPPAVRLELASQPFSRRARAPHVERLLPPRTDRAAVRAH